MYVALAIISALGVTLATFVAVSLLLGAVSVYSRFAHLLVFVEPWRTAARLVMLLGSLWLGLVTFAAF